MTALRQTLPLAVVAAFTAAGCASSRQTAATPGTVPPAAARYDAAVAPDREAEGTLAGGAIGAVVGTIVGHQLGERGGGAVVGALTGAVLGNLDGREKQAEDDAVRQAGYDAQALTNFDLIRLSQAGVGQEVILGAVRDRGGRFDLSPDGIVSLKQSGVSDAVIAGVQRQSTAAVTPATPAVVIERAVPVYQPVMVAPARRVGPRGRVSMGVGF